MAAYLGGALALSLVGAMGIAPMTPVLGERGTEPAACEVNVMKGPEGASWGNVMDIETVPGMGTVYYGSYEIPTSDGGYAQRAFVWHGLDAPPVPVGPAGTLHDIALELTASGYINGTSIMDESGFERGWVQNLRTGRLTWVETGDASSYVRRINNRGEPAGTLFGEGFSADAAWWPHSDRPPEILDAGELGYAEAWGITDRRDVVGSYAVEVPLGVVPQGVIWSAKGEKTLLASNDGVTADTFPRLLTEAGQAAGAAWFGSWDAGHSEAARWPSPDRIEPLGLLPNGGFSGAYGQSQDGWVVGLADRFDPESPAATEWGAVEYSVLWTEDAGSVRVLPSPYAVEHDLTDWHEWYGGVAHGVSTALNQVGSRSHVGWEQGAPIMGPTVYVNASECGVEVTTTHTAFWEGDMTLQRRAASGQPDAYRHETVRERVTGLGK